eukprot:874110-Prorocentrum_minimum.AAC.1
MSRAAEARKRGPPAAERAAQKGSQSSGSATGTVSHRSRSTGAHTCRRAINATRRERPHPEA